MGVFARPDSSYWWLYLPTNRSKEKTDIPIGETTAQRRDSRKLADDRYHQRMNELAARLYRLPVTTPALRFAKYAETYTTHFIAHHRGKSRELELLVHLVAFFGDDLLTQIDKERVGAYQNHRRQKVAARTVNREVDLLKSMLREACPKYLSVSPLVGMKELPVVPPKRRLLQPSEETKILKHLSTVDRAIFLIGLDCLIRLGDILDLRREDDHGRTLYVRDPKDPRQSTAYSVPISARVRAALNALPDTGPYYFSYRRTAGSDNARGAAVRWALRRACKRAKVPYGRKIDGITFHWGTRRTGATRMLQRGAELKAVQAVGHWKRPDVMLEIYAETTTKAQQAAVNLVSAPSKPARKTG